MNEWGDRSFGEGATFRTARARVSVASSTTSNGSDAVASIVSIGSFVHSFIRRARGGRTRGRRRREGFDRPTDRLKDRLTSLSFSLSFSSTRRKENWDQPARTDKYWQREKAQMAYADANAAGSHPGQRSPW